MECHDSLSIINILNPAGSPFGHVIFNHPPSDADTRVVSGTKEAAS